jgi:hypothetical protein
VSRWLLDTSALAQRSDREVHRRLTACIEEGAAVCDMVVAESLIRARSPDDLAARRRFFAVMDVLAVDSPVWNAVGVFADRLAAAGATVATGDAVIAACAALNEMTVIHFDTDYEVLGEVCEVAHEWVIPRPT